MLQLILKSLYASFLLLLLFDPINSYADRVIPSENVQTSVRVRSGPGNYQVIDRLRLGESADLLDSVPYWYKVQLDNGLIGYVSKSWTEVISGQIPTTSKPLRSRTETAGGDLEIHFVDVGQGDSTLVICPNGNNILIDAGTLDSNRSGGPIRNYILEQIGSSRPKINTLIITHPDKDHYILLPEVLSGISVDQIFIVGSEDYYISEFWTWLESFPQNKVTVLHQYYFNPLGRPNNQIDCGEAEVYILAAAVVANSSPTNAMSIVLMIRYSEVDAILTGDATHDTENEIMSKYPNGWLDVEILKVGHHGSLATSTSKKWADIVRPEIAVVSAGERSQFGHPRGEVIFRLEPHTASALPHLMSYALKSDIPREYRWVDLENYTESIYLTATNGYIVLKTDGHDIDVNTIDFDKIEE